MSNEGVSGLAPAPRAPQTLVADLAAEVIVLCFDEVLQHGVARTVLMQVDRQDTRAEHNP